MTQRKSSRRPPGKAAHRGSGGRDSRGSPHGAPETVLLYGHHAAAAALANPVRVIRRIVATDNALQRLATYLTGGTAPEKVKPDALDRLVGDQAVHQGVVVEAEPLPVPEVADFADARLLVMLDQITDPHNVGAIVRSAAAFGAAAVIVQARHSPPPERALAKAASGALEHVALTPVTNLSRALEELAEIGFFRIGLDSEAPEPLAGHVSNERCVLVLGAEDKGLRRLTRENCDAVCRLEAPGAIASLNVSNAAAVALHVLSQTRR